MLNAAGSELGERWPEARDYAETEFKKTAETLLLIDKLLREEKIDQERARLHFEFQKASMKTVLLTVEGLGLLAAERAINAALDVVRKTVNRALGFGLL